MRSDPDELIVDQPDAPLRITAYEADYDGVRLFRDDGIRHEVRFRSGIDRRIEAFRLVFVMFSLFNDSIGQERGVYLDAVPPNAFGNGTWNHDPPNAETFHVGAVYVEKVRYANGDVWSASESEVQTQLDQVGQRPLKKKDS